MKKILLSSIILFLFSVSIVLFQISCKKEAVADVAVSSAGGSNLGVILFGKRVQNNTKDELWTANYDGTNQKKLEIPIPAARRLDNAYLSPDGKLVVLDTYEIPNENISHTYTCSIDGSNFKEILSSANQGDVFGVY
jgi:hypothetical protein